MATKFSEEEADSFLPDGKSKIENLDPRQLIYTLIAEPKWGKTTFFCDFEDALLVAFEQGHAFQEVAKVIIDAWDVKKSDGPYKDDNGEIHMTVMELVATLQGSSKYKFIIFDTADMAAKMCLDYHLPLYNMTHPSDQSFGKGYDIAQNQPFRAAVNAIMRTGRGIGFITHSKIKSTTFAAGEKSKKETSLPGGIQHLIITQSDIVMHGEFGRKLKGSAERDRVVRLKGDAETLAGGRANKKFISLPEKFVLDTENQYSQWSSFFTDRTAADREYKNFLIRTKQLDESEAETEIPAEVTSEEQPAATRRSKKTK